ncbi:WecB/TagA/CpsF family glycosyltransferase [Clostridium perfringens]|uniref:WecB/TagA/CpsF family glycosyltransferase n=1 Tax=Clostridium perfringens TaxID=1502 RepID=UPI0022E4C4B2|nr:WecB/TagA/CpsF family glycosyltransferase [Clostridium perfringens]
MVKIFNLDFYDENLENLKIELEKDIDENKKVRVYTPNVDHIINIKSNENVFLKYSKAEYIIADGWPVVATAKVKKTPIHKITGVDLMDELLKLADKKSLNIFFLGATDYTLKKLKFNIERDFNNINLINYNNGYFSEKESERIVKKINDTNSNILFVGMGSPKQEIWITENIEKLNVNITIAIGGALKIYSEEIERAPKFVQQIGMEWFYRFMKEPKRLFSRYFVKYPKFIKHFIDEIKE